MKIINQWRYQHPKQIFAFYHILYNSKIPHFFMLGRERINDCVSRQCSIECLFDDRFFNCKEKLEIRLPYKMQQFEPGSLCKFTQNYTKLRQISEKNHRKHWFYPIRQQKTRIPFEQFWKMHISKGGKTILLPRITQYPIKLPIEFFLGGIHEGPNGLRYHSWITTSSISIQ